MVSCKVELHMVGYFKAVRKPKGDIQFQFYFPLLNEVKRGERAREQSLRMKRSEKFSVRVGL